MSSAAAAAAVAAISSEKAIISVGELVSGAELASAVPATKEGRERAGRMCKLIVDFMRGCALVAGSNTMSQFRMRPFLSPTDTATKENWMLLAF